ncbi:histidine kinase [Salicibibacter halophilus]|uniref:Histidine kinase n=1 Tax=Salicibibacter halophilus TaxID=2502791 RepID=A0A514LKV8_9BACI|nr:histidine kinase [Salicibibacter halophilus]QDI92500.1 histidine kinase [Salicibibacter halophilus]
MDQNQTRLDECILTCVYYGPSGDRLIKRGAKIAKKLNCPFYILTINETDVDDLDHDRNHYLKHWESLADQYNVTEFIIQTSNNLPISKMISQVAKEKQATQVIIGQTTRSRWQELTKGSTVNTLLKELPFVDLHIIAMTRGMKNYKDEHFEKGVHAYLVKTNDDQYRLTFNHTHSCSHSGVFYKELNTDFNNGVFTFKNGKKVYDIHITDDYVKEYIPRQQNTEN